MFLNMLGKFFIILFMLGNNWRLVFVVGDWVGYFFYFIIVFELIVIDSISLKKY